MQDLLKSLPKIPIRPKAPLPETAGVYIFFSKAEAIYIGKAINLKRRVSSYFDLDVMGKTARMMGEAASLSYIRVGSELESLLLEARLIRKYMPKYNFAAKDDKHPLYIRISKEKYPRIITARKIAENDKNLAFFGPFPSSASVRTVLRMLRRIFPYSDHKLGKRSCLYSHIGLCDPCPNQIEQNKNLEIRIRERKTYLKNIRRVKAVLSGKFDGVKKELLKDMENASKNQNFEEAATFRNKIKSLDYITQPQMPTEFYMQNPNLYEDIRQKEVNDLKRILSKNGIEKIKNLERVECFDIAHFAGRSATASMVTFVNGEADKNYYRHFKIRQKKGPSDVDSLKEVIQRRIKHLADWGRPDLIVVDGGKAQVGVFYRELESYVIPVVGIAKRFETLVIPVKLDGRLAFRKYKLPRGPSLNFIQRMRNEAHRFARRYHHHLISKIYTNEGNP